MQGKVIKGELTADTVSGFYAALRGMELYALDYREVRDARASGGRSRRVAVKELIVFCRKMGAMMGAGLSLTGSLDILYRTAETPRLKALYLSVYENIQRGMPLSQAMRGEQNAFPPFLMNMVESGEASGSLDSILTALAGHYENENKLLNKIRAATIYPAVLLFVSIAVVIILFTFVLPSMLGMFGGQELPPITQFVMGVSRFMTGNWPGIIAVIAAVAVLLLNVRNIRPLKQFFDYAKLRFPAVRKMNRVVYAARFSRAMSILYSSGIPMLNALRLSANTLDNLYIDQLFVRLLQDISTGESLSAAIERLDVFDPLLSPMIRIGEESGSLDGILANMSDYYDTESSGSITRMIALLEPVMLVVLAVIVGIVLAAVMLPIYGMYSGIL
jgi:type IV pilus assembly protein PilC